MKHLKKTDLEIYKLIQEEEKRQQNTLQMIPSENTASKAVEEAMGSVFGNKYGEGYPEKRYYQGNKVIDKLESMVIERAKKVYGVPAANVQALSGSPANFAVYTALLSPGDTLMGLSLASGGHLTHGAAFNASSRYFRAVNYDTDKNGMIDYEEVRKIAKKEKPKIIIASTTAYARILDWKKFAEIAEEVGAYLMADISHISGLIVGEVYPSPVDYAHVITTTTHKSLRGPRAALILSTEKGLKKDPDLAKKIDKAIIPGIQGGPHFNNIAAIGVALKEASTAKYKKYAQQVIANAKTLAQELQKYDFKLVTGGTDSHLLLVDLRNKGLMGNTVAEALDAVGIVLNRNGVPQDPNPPFFPSGIRMGTPGITSRKLEEKEMKLIAKWIDEVTKAVAETKELLKVTAEEEKKKSVRKNIIEKTKKLKAIKKEVLALCKKFPLPTEY
ncbi:serine hydroxymethyltransferase [Candidatus Roizmanbacteria bacterium]|nr:serine hydroxymethyltransferase [Candidatus Roizmanbacteria bacterium]